MDTPLQPYGTVPKKTVPSVQSSAERIGRFKASKMIALASWQMLKQDKEMLLFPLLSSLVSLAVTVGFGLVWFFGFAGGNVDTLRTYADSNTQHVFRGAEYLWLFLFYLTTYFIATYFEAGVVAIAHARIKGGDFTFADGMHAASARVGKLFTWSLVNATVGMILRTIAERSKILGRIVAGLLGAAWSILTFFVLPALMLEDIGIRQALSRSGETIKKTWGETVIVNVGAGLFMFVLMLVGVALFVAAVFTGSASIILLAVLLLIAYLIILILVANTMGVIFRVVLYEYATNGALPEAFPEQVVRYAFAPKK